MFIRSDFKRLKAPVFFLFDSVKKELSIVISGYYWFYFIIFFNFASQNKWKLDYTNYLLQDAKMEHFKIEAQYIS